MKKSYPPIYSNLNLQSLDYRSAAPPLELETMSPLMLKFWLFVGAVVVVHIYRPITGQRQTLTIGRSENFSLQ